MKNKKMSASEQKRLNEAGEQIGHEAAKQLMVLAATMGGPGEEGMQSACLHLVREMAAGLASLMAAGSLVSRRSLAAELALGAMNGEKDQSGAQRSEMVAEDDGSEAECVDVEDIRGRIERMVRKAKREGKAVVQALEEVVLSVAPSGDIGVGFVTPDEMGKTMGELSGQELSDRWSHWYDKHFAPVVSIAAASTDGASKDKKGRSVYVFRLQTYMESGECQSVGPVLIEESKHEVHEGGKPVSGGAALIVLSKGNQAITSGCVVALADEFGALVRQINLFAFPVLTDSEGVRVSVHALLKTWVEKIERETGVGLWKMTVDGLPICKSHKVLAFPDHMGMGAEQAPGKPLSVH